MVIASLRESFSRILAQYVNNNSSYKAIISIPNCQILETDRIRATYVDRIILVREFNALLLFGAQRYLSRGVTYFNNKLSEIGIR